MNHPIRSLVPIALAASSCLHGQSANTIHYWDMDTLDAGVPTDVVGGITTSKGANFAADNTTYGASPASGNYLVSDLSGAGGVPLSASVNTEGGMNFGTGSFSFSYWTYDDTTDGDVRGPRVFDCLSTTTTGVQLGTQADGYFNLRFDDDTFSDVVSNRDGFAPFPTLKIAEDQWVHVAVTANRDPGINEAEVFFDGVSQGTYDISALTGLIFPTQPLEIGAINGGVLGGGLQSAGLDDLAFYTGVLSSQEITDLAAGNITPLDLFTPPPPPVIPPIAHYWDFDTLDGSSIPADVQGNLVMSEPNGFVDVSIDPTYDEAYFGSLGSLNTALGSNLYLQAEVHDGVGPTALNWGMDNFSFSYWAYDHSDVNNDNGGAGDPGDGDVRGARIFDCLNGTTTGITVNTQGAGYLVVRIDDDEGNDFISTALTGTVFETLAMPAEQWVHVAVNVDRSNDELTVYFDGVLQGTADISSLTGEIFPTTDLDIGVINGGGSTAAAQKSGLDDLAFYPGLLSTQQIADLAAASTTPLDIFPSFEPVGRIPVTDVTYVGGTLSVTFPTESGKTYSVYGGDDLSNADSWPELTTLAIVGDDTDQTFATTPGVARYFIQVRED